VLTPELLHILRKLAHRWSKVEFRDPASYYGTVSRVLAKSRLIHPNSLSVYQLVEARVGLSRRRRLGEWGTFRCPKNFAVPRSLTEWIELLADRRYWPKTMANASRAQLLSGNGGCLDVSGEYFSQGEPKSTNAKAALHIPSAV
jgi:hypothetical protein